MIEQEEFSESMRFYIDLLLNQATRGDIERIESTMYLIYRQGFFEGREEGIKVAFDKVGQILGKRQ